MEFTREMFVAFRNDVVVINTTPHSITMQDTNGELKTVEPCGALLNGTAQEEAVDELFVKTKFIGNEEGGKIIEDITNFFNSLSNSSNYKLVIIGSIIAAQSYPGKVAAMCPVPGFERVPPNEKRMRCDKFTIY
jgi:hypothetical protein